MGSGKSTITRLLEKQGFSRVPEFMEFLSPFSHANLASWTQSQRVRLLFAIEQIRRSSNEHNSALDRTFLTCIAHDYAMSRLGFQRDLSPYSSLDFTLCCSATHFIVLLVDEGTRSRRLLNRTAPPDEFLVDAGYNSFIEDFYRRLSVVIPIEFINTNLVSPNDILQFVLAKIQETPSNAAVLDHSTFRHALEIAADG